MCSHAYCEISQQLAGAIFPSIHHTAEVQLQNHNSQDTDIRRNPGTQHCAALTSQ